jgi:hypothetical protein
MSASDRVLDPFDVHTTKKVNLAAADRPGLTEQVTKLRSMMTTSVAAKPSPAVVPAAAAPSIGVASGASAPAAPAR